MKAKFIVGVLAAGIFVATSGLANAQKKFLDSHYKAGDMYSGYLVSTLETQRMQDDDLENPSFLWVDQGVSLWSTAEGEAGKSCASCHKDATASMKGVGATYPKWNAAEGKVLNLELRINLCRAKNMKAKEWKYESDEMIGMTAYVRMQSRGMPVNVSIDGPAKAAYEKGKAFYFQRRGLLDMSCANCHIENPGNTIRSDLLSQGMTNGFPTYRLKWQKLGTLHRRFRGCNDQVRAEPYKRGSDEYVALELFLAHRGNGLKIETPSVRR